jgi:hypothetical protein
VYLASANSLSTCLGQADPEIKRIGGEQRDDKDNVISCGQPSCMPLASQASAQWSAFVISPTPMMLACLFTHGVQPTRCVMSIWRRE